MKLLKNIFHKKVDKIIDNSKNPHCELIYTDKFDNKYYKINDIGQGLYADRYVHAETMGRFAQMNVDRETLGNLIDEMHKAAKKGGKDDIGKILAITFEIKNRFEMISEKKSLLELAATYFLIQDEDPMFLDKSVIDKKIHLWENDISALNFFLLSAAIIADKLGDMSHADFLDYLKKIEPHTQKVNNYFL